MAIRLGTRASALARWQADWVAEQLRGLGVDVELVPISTTGDRQQDSIGTLGQRGVFTKEIQRALLDRRIDLAVHSLKDLPTDTVAGLALTAVPERAPIGDALVSEKYAALDDLPRGATVGTGSLRRRTQLWHHRPDLNMKDLRGNVDTRLEKLRRGDFDAVILAVAGLERLGLERHIRQVLPAEVMLPAIGQGALGLETRSDDAETIAWVAKLDHTASHWAVLAERAMLAALEGGCLAPIAAWGRLEHDMLLLTGRVLSADGAEMIETAAAAPQANARQAEMLGRRVAEMLLQQRAAELIQTSRDQPPPPAAGTASA